MDLKKYTEKRAILIERMLNAENSHCKRTARARKIDIEKLDKEWQKLMTSSMNTSQKKNL